jgi:hypothetical protein
MRPLARFGALSYLTIEAAETRGITSPPELYSIEPGRGTGAVPKERHRWT